MDEKTHEALEGSIKKWEAIVDGTGADQGADNCPLCAMFIEECDPEDDSIDNYGCHGCPVKEKTGQQECAGSPFYEWRDSIPHDQKFPFFAITEPQKAAAKKELEFLKSLRPKE